MTDADPGAQDPWAEWRRLLDEASPDPLKVLGLIARYQKYLTAIEREAVRVARALDRSWEEIGSALGVSRQAVWQRHHWRDPAEVRELLSSPQPQLHLRDTIQRPPED